MENGVAITICSQDKCCAPTLDDLQQLASALDIECWRLSSDKAQVVASYLSAHPLVCEVHYPGLKQDPLFVEASQTLKSGFGPIVWFESFSASYLIDCRSEYNSQQLICELEHLLSDN